MFRNQSFGFLVSFIAALILGFTALLGSIAFQGVASVNAILSHFYSDFYRSIFKLQGIEDIYEAIVRSSIQRVLTKTSQPNEVVEVVEAGIAEAGVRWKAYMEVERATEGGRQLLNQEFENAMNGVNIAWIPLKSLFQGGDLAKIQEYIIQDFYPKMDALDRSYSHLVSRWMSQLDSARISRQDMANWLWRVLALVLPLCLMFTIGLFYWLWSRVNGHLSRLASQIETIQREGADFTKRLELQGSLETNRVSLKFNQFMDQLLTMMRRVKISGLSIATTMPQITQTSQEMSRRIADFSTFTTEVGATAKEISVTSQELVKLMTDVSQTATNTAQLAVAGQSGLGSLEATMKQMEEASRQISKRLAIISEKAANITTVVTTINKFADQTNLLSLNASIEAEKAGEYGLGFAVVAREIRRLADQVGLATYDIEQMVKEMKSAVSSGVMEMDKFSDEMRNDVRDVRTVGSQLVQIIQQVQTLIPCFDSVHSAVQTQAEGARQISDSMSQLSEAVEHASSTLQRAGSSITNVVEVTQDLQREVSTFVVDSV